MIKNLTVGKVYEINEISSGTPCLKCDSCIRMRLMEMGLLGNDKIQIVGHSYGLWRINIFNEDDIKYSTLALREEEIREFCIL